jgi:hypothetical protein
MTTNPDTTTGDTETGSSAPETEPEGKDTTPDVIGRDEATQGQDDTTDSDDDGDDDGEPTGRAAKYRQRAKDAEARATELAATVERLQRAQVEHAINTTGIKPAAVLAVSELGDLLDDDGLPDSKKITAAADKARQQLGITRPTVDGMRYSGLHSGAGLPAPKRDGWADAFARRDE